MVAPSSKEPPSLSEDVVWISIGAIGPSDGFPSCRNQGREEHHRYLRFWAGKQVRHLLDRVSALPAVISEQQ